MGFERNMTMGEILGQILVAREHLGDNRPDWPVLRNLVFMGMGEPLLNLREVMRALQSLNNDKGLNFSPRRITVSTCGIEKGLAELGASGLAYLAVSLHAPTQELRARIMPKAARWPLDQLSCLPEPLTPAKGFSWSRHTSPWRSATLFIIYMASWLW